LRRSGKPILANGQTLSIAAVTAAARHGTRVVLDDAPDIKEKVLKSRTVIAQKVDSGASVYGLSTGFGGSGALPKRGSSAPP
jgi:phenylalanine ammonia-lyase